MLEIMDFSNSSLEALKNHLSEIDVKVRLEELPGDLEQFRCSIELTHFAPID